MISASPVPGPVSAPGGSEVANAANCSSGETGLISGAGAACCCTGGRGRYGSEGTGAMTSLESATLSTMSAQEQSSPEAAVNSRNRQRCEDMVTITPVEPLRRTEQARWS